MLRGSVAQKLRVGLLRPPPTGRRRTLVAASPTEIARAQSRHRRQVLRHRARTMRHSPTLSEQALWVRLRSRQVLGVQFRRQVIVGDFIVDFCASSVRVIVEVEGGYHAAQVQLDARRERKLQRAGYHVVRLSHELVIAQPEAAVEQVRVAVAARLAARRTLAAR